MSAGRGRQGTLLAGVRMPCPYARFCESKFCEESITEHVCKIWLSIFVLSWTWGWFSQCCRTSKAKIIRTNVVSKAAADANKFAKKKLRTRTVCQIQLSLAVLRQVSVDVGFQVRCAASVHYTNPANVQLEPASNAVVHSSRMHRLTRLGVKRTFTVCC